MHLTSKKRKTLYFHTDAGFSSKDRWPPANRDATARNEAQPEVVSQVSSAAADETWETQSIDGLAALKPVTQCALRYWVSRSRMVLPLRTFGRPVPAL